MKKILYSTTITIAFLINANAAESPINPNSKICPELIPTLTTNLSATVINNKDGSFDYSYRVKNSNSSDYIDGVDILGVPVNSETKPLKNWLHSQQNNIISWSPIVPYTGTDELLGTRFPSDGAIAPGTVFNGFNLHSNIPPGLLIFRYGTRRAISDEMQSFKRWFENSQDKPISNKDQYEENLSEVYGEMCGGTIGLDRRMMVTEVVTGPSIYPVAKFNLLSQSPSSGYQFEIVPLSKDSKLIFSGSYLSLYNAETDKKIKVQSSYQTNASGLPSLAGVLDPRLFNSFTCRTKSILVDIISNGKVVMRTKIEGSSVGIPSVCKRS